MNNGLIQCVEITFNGYVGFVDKIENINLYFKGKNNFIKDEMIKLQFFEISSEEYKYYAKDNVCPFKLLPNTLTN